MRRRQGALREGEITPHAPRCRCLRHPITILAKENPNSFARIPDFREIRAILHQSSHPRRKTSHFFCKDSHPAKDFVRNSPRFTDNRLPSDSLSIKQGILRTKHLTLQFTIAGHAPHTTKTKEPDRETSVELFIVAFPVVTVAAGSSPIGSSPSTFSREVSYSE